MSTEHDDTFNITDLAVVTRLPLLTLDDTPPFFLERNTRADNNLIKKEVPHTYPLPNEAHPSPFNVTAHESGNFLCTTHYPASSSEQHILGPVPKTSSLSNGCYLISQDKKHDCIYIFSTKTRSFVHHLNSTEGKIVGLYIDDDKIFVNRDNIQNFITGYSLQTGRAIESVTAPIGWDESPGECIFLKNEKSYIALKAIKNTIYFYNGVIFKKLILNNYQNGDCLRLILNNFSDILVKDNFIFELKSPSLLQLTFLDAYDDVKWGGTELSIKLNINTFVWDLANKETDIHAQKILTFTHYGSYEYIHKLDFYYSHQFVPKAMKKSSKGFFVFSGFAVDFFGAPKNIQENYIERNNLYFLNIIEDFALFFQKDGLFHFYKINEEYFEHTMQIPFISQVPTIGELKINETQWNTTLKLLSLRVNGQAHLFYVNLKNYFILPILFHASHDIFIEAAYNIPHLNESAIASHPTRQKLQFKHNDFINTDAWIKIFSQLSYFDRLMLSQVSKNFYRIAHAERINHSFGKLFTSEDIDILQSVISGSPNDKSKFQLKPSKTSAYLVSLGLFAGSKMETQDYAVKHIERLTY